MTISPSPDLMAENSGDRHANPTNSAMSALLQSLAPYIAVAALAYPVLVWPLLEAEVVSLDPVSTKVAIDGPSSMLLRAYFSILLALGVLSFAFQSGWRSLGLTAPVLLSIASYLLWAGVTGYWAVEPEISTRRFFLAVFVAGTIVTSTLASRDHERVLRIAFWMFFVMVVINTVSVLTTAPTALGHAAIYPHKNYFAAMTSIMVLFALYQVTNGTRLTRAVALVMLAVAVWFLIVAQSKTCTALVVITPILAYGATFLCRSTRISPALTLPLFAALLFAIYEFGASSGLWDFQAAANLIFGDPTLTQRTDIWAFAIKKIEERPWLGYGYEVFWGAGFNSPSVREGPGFVAQMPHAHNGYLDVVLHTGYVGLAILTIIIFSALHAAGRVASRSPGLAGFVLSLIVFNLLYNCFESTWFRSFGLKSMVFILAISLLAMARSRAR